MAKRAICDVCHREGALESSYGTIPEEWFTLRQSYSDEVHLCSHACLVTEVERRRPPVPEDTPKADILASA